MPRDNDARLDFVAGQVHGLVAFALAIIHAHPDPTALMKYLKVADMVAEGIAGGSTVSDDFLKGVDDVSGRLESAVQTVREHKGTTHKESP